MKLKLLLILFLFISLVTAVTFFPTKEVAAQTYTCSWDSASSRCTLSSHTCPRVTIATSRCVLITDPTVCNNTINSVCPTIGSGTAVLPVCSGNGTTIDTAIGCIPIGDTNLLVVFFLRWGLGIGGGIALLLMLIAGFNIMTSSGDPKRLQAGKELLTAAISGLILLIFSVVIVRILGIDILGIIP